MVSRDAEGSGKTGQTQETHHLDHSMLRTRSRQVEFSISVAQLTKSRSSNVDRHARLDPENRRFKVNVRHVPHHTGSHPDPTVDAPVLAHGRLVVGARRVVRPSSGGHDLASDRLEVMQAQNFGEGWSEGQSELTLKFGCGEGSDV